MDGKLNRSDALGPIIQRLYHFLHRMEAQQIYKFFGTSLLIVYEGDKKRLSKNPEDLLDIRLVDFAHAVQINPEGFSEPDYNTMFGLKSLIKCLEQLNLTDSTSSIV